jgi:hypothetical protein
VQVVRARERRARARRRWRVGDKLVDEHRRVGKALRRVRSTAELARGAQQRRNGRDAVRLYKYLYVYIKTCYAQPASDGRRDI